MPTINQTDWSGKHKREGRYYAFGFMANSYGLINQGKAVELATFLADMASIAELAQTFIEEDLERERKSQELPEINEVAM